MAPFEMNCNNIDIDGDGKPDCIACGRMSTAVAFNPRNGKRFSAGWCRAFLLAELPFIAYVC